VTIDCPDELAGALVPALIAQPIVENAVKYGVARSSGPARIDIIASRVGGQLVLAISDNGPGPGQGGAGLGVGLRNVAARLRNRFGAAHRFDAAATEQGGFRVTLALPLSRTRG
jgi:LytS/YehU family sensor histidine kinase